MVTAETDCCSKQVLERKALRKFFAGTLLVLLLVQVLEIRRNDAGAFSSINRMKGEVILPGTLQELSSSSITMVPPFFKPIILQKSTEAEKPFVRWESWVYTKTNVHNFTNVDFTANSIRKSDTEIKISTDKPSNRKQLVKKSLKQDTRPFRKTLALNDRSAFMMETDLAFSVVAPPRMPQQRRTKIAKEIVDEGENMEHNYTYPLWKTTSQAEYFHCDIAAMNGGPFHADGTSCGPLVLEGGYVVPSSIQERINSNLTTSADWVGMGMARNSIPSNNSTKNVTTAWYWMIGPYSELVSRRAPDQESLVMDSFVSGFGWLIYDGKIVVDPNSDPDNNPTGALRAPRTAMGLTREGHLIMFVADGCERCLRNRGPTLWELADMMQERTHHRVAYAINLDGGGSSTIVYYEEDETIGHVPRQHSLEKHSNSFLKSQGRQRKTNRFNCLGVPSPIKCERKVASVLCLRQPQHQLQK